MKIKALGLVLSAVAGFLAAVPSASASENRAELPPREVVEVPTPAYARYREVRAETRRLRQAGDTAGLEALAAQLRQSKEAQDGGTWLLTTFYDNAVYVPREEPAQQRAMDFYERWAREQPGSITAQVCRARALTRFAWNARGSGWANSVTDEGWRLFGERLDQAWAVLQEARKLPDQCPGWTEAAQTIALGQGWDPLAYFKMVNAAIEQEPTYGRYYSNACYFLFPRWYGETGDFEKWIAEQAAQAPAEMQDRQYARLVWMADRNRMDEEIVFAPDRLDWERTRRGFEDWLKANPDNLMVRFQYLRFALLADDRETAQGLFEQLGGRYFSPMWDDEAQYDAAREYAYHDGPNPLLEVMEDTDESPSLDPAIGQWIQLGAKWLGGFLGGLLAGTLLLILAAQRGRAGIGLLFAFAAVIIGTLFGTLATTLPGAGLWFYFRRKRGEHPPALTAPPGWLVFIWVLLIAGTYLGLQIAAIILPSISFMVENGHFDADQLLKHLMETGISFQVFFTASWISFLLLLIVCGPLNRADWRRWLGLHRPAWGPALAGCLGGALVLAGLGFLLEPYADSETREAIELLALGMQTPVLYFLSMVVVAPILEELIFRGYAYHGWIDKIGFWGTSLLTSVIFMACHLQYGWFGLLGVFAVGMMLAALRWRTGSIYPCILLHAANNCGYFVSQLPFFGE